MSSALASPGPNTGDTRPAAGGRPYLTAVPDCEPPFDDERSAATRLERLRQVTRRTPVGSGAGTGPRTGTGTGSGAGTITGLATVAVGGGTATAAQVRTSTVTALKPGAGSAVAGGTGTAVPDTVLDADVPGWSQDPDMGVRRTGTADLPPAARSGRVLARALVEVLSGQRPLAQLRVHCAPEVYAGLARRPIVRGALAHLVNVRVCEPADGVAEISAVFRRGERARAIAFRIQGVDGRWRVTALQTG